MKNVTLSIPEQTLQKAREYAKRHNTTLNNLIRDFLRNTVENQPSSFAESLKKAQSTLSANTKLISTREELYEE